MRPVLPQSDRTISVLDVGCGTGDMLDGFPRDQLDVYGVDLVPEMAAAASRTHPEDHFAAASAEALPFPPREMDLVICLGMLEYLPDPLPAIQAMRDVLRPGGHLIVSFPNRKSLFRKLSTVEVQMERQLFKALAWCRGRSSDGNAAPSYRHRQWAPADVFALLASTGFQVRETRFNTFGLWGLAGRLSISLQLSAWMSERWGGRERPSSLAGCTMVVRADKL